MVDRNESNICYDQYCRHAGKSHYHVMTNDGGYVKFIVEKPKKSYDKISIGDDYNANTR